MCALANRLTTGSVPRAGIAAALLAILFVGPATAQVRLGDAKPIQSSAERQLPGIASDFLKRSADWSDSDAKLALLRALSQWLSSNFDLPSTPELPRVSLVAPLRISAIRYGQLSGSAARHNAPVGDGAADRTVAIYVDSERTIYLPDNFTGSTPAELSVLLHEIVHHIQNLARLRYDCPQAREKTAYLAQERWLNQFDQDLSSEFQIDPFTILVNTGCIF
jgi:hypothetical protein